MKFLATCAFAALIAPAAMAASPFEGDVLAASQPRAPAQPTDDACRFSITYESETVKVWVCVVPGRREDDRG
jgi:hypothetical protein